MVRHLGNWPPFYPYPNTPWGTFGKNPPSDPLELEELGDPWCERGAINTRIGEYSEYRWGIGRHSRPSRLIFEGEEWHNYHKHSFPLNITMCYCTTSTAPLHRGGPLCRRPWDVNIGWPEKAFIAMLVMRPTIHFFDFIDVANHQICRYNAFFTIRLICELSIAVKYLLSTNINQYLKSIHILTNNSNDCHFSEWIKFESDLSRIFSPLTFFKSNQILL